MTDFDFSPNDVEDDDDLIIDFTDVQAKSNDPIPRDWYHLQVTNLSRSSTKNQGKTMPAGTVGANFTLQVQEGDFTGRMVFYNEWIWPDRLGHLKNFLEKTGAVSEDDLNGPMKWSLLQQVIGAEIYGLVRVKPENGQYPASNDIQSWRSMDDPPDSMGASLP